MTAPRKGCSLEKENVAVDVVSPPLGWGAPEHREGGELRPESPPHCPDLWVPSSWQLPWAVLVSLLQ